MKTLKSTIEQTTKGKVRASKYVKSLVVAGVIAAVSMPAAAKKYRDYNDHSNQVFDYARVVSSEPIYESYQVNNPVRQCWDERVPVRRSSYGNKRNYDSKTPEVVGAIIGGAIGNRVGKKGGGKARDVATVVGAVLGGSVARDIKHNRRYQNDRYSRDYERTRYETVQRCEMRDSYTTQRELVGYDVAYKYRGNVYHTQMADHPGKKIRVKVTVDPV